MPGWPYPQAMVTQFFKMELIQSLCCKQFCGNVKASNRKANTHTFKERKIVFVLMVIYIKGSWWGLRSVVGLLRPWGNFREHRVHLLGTAICPYTSCSNGRTGGRCGEMHVCPSSTVRQVGLGSLTNSVTLDSSLTWVSVFSSLKWR